MNITEAREIVEKQNKQLNFNTRMNTQTVSQEYAYVSACSFIEGYNSRTEQVRELVESLEWVVKRHHKKDFGILVTAEEMEKIEKALAAFQETSAEKDKGI